MEKDNTMKVTINGEEYNLIESGGYIITERDDYTHKFAILAKKGDEVFEVKTITNKLI